MDYYYTAIALLGLRDSNLPPFKWPYTSFKALNFAFREARLKRYKSIRKMVDLIDTASKLAPSIPSEAFFLNPNDRTLIYRVCCLTWNSWMGWRYDLSSHSTLKVLLPTWRLGIELGKDCFHSKTGLNSWNRHSMLTTTTTSHTTSDLELSDIFSPSWTSTSSLISIGTFIGSHSLYWCGAYRRNRVETLKVNLFDEYVQLRAKELVEQNEYLLEHEGNLFWNCTKGIMNIITCRYQEIRLVVWRFQRNSHESPQISKQPRCLRFQGLRTYPSRFYQKIQWSKQEDATHLRRKKCIPVILRFGSCKFVIPKQFQELIILLFDLRNPQPS